MTTTLRPAGPEERGEDGARARDYTVCVNSRPVGRITLRTDVRFGPAFGEIGGLSIDEPDRGRGRGTVAVLAGEEVLRSWGCRYVAMDVPAGAEPALRMAAAVGCTERSRIMAKDLAGAPGALPPGSSLRPLGREEAEHWLARGRDTFIGSLVADGVPRDVAEARATSAVAGMVHDGLPVPGTALVALDHGGGTAGVLWLRTDEPAWVFSVEVDAAQRGRGHGRALMTAAENLTRDAGRTTLGLNVFSPNTTARRLYESLGYRTVSHHFAKPLL